MNRVCAVYGADALTACCWRPVHSPGRDFWLDGFDRLQCETVIGVPRRARGLEAAPVQPRSQVLHRPDRGWPSAKRSPRVLGAPGGIHGSRRRIELGPSRRLPREGNGKGGAAHLT